MIAALAVTLSLALPAPAQHTDSLPDSPAARVFREWLRAVNSRDTAAVRAYARRYEAERPDDPASVQETVDNIMDVVRQSGGMRLVKWTARSPEQLELTLEDAHRRRLAMRFAVTFAGGGYRVADVGLQPVGAPAATGAAPLPDGLALSTLADSVSRRLDALAAQGRFDGALLLAGSDGPPLLRRAWGTANRATGADNTPETRFTLASTGKMFTAVAIGQLVERGRVALDAPIARYLPDYPDRAFAARATVRQLLNHTSGLGSYWGPEFERRRASLQAPADHLPLFVNEPRPFEPGERFRYSNAGFQVLGMIIERASGLSFYDYVQRHIFSPAGMTRTGYYGPSGEAPDATALGYTDDGGALRDNESGREIRGGPAGGGFSTVDDLLRFGRALLGGRLLQRATLEQLTTGSSDGGRYGLGFMTIGAGAARAFGHNGGAPGMATWFLVWPERGVIEVLLTNRDPGLLAAVQQPLMRAIANPGMVP